MYWSNETWSSIKFIFSVHKKVCILFDVLSIKKALVYKYIDNLTKVAVLYTEV